MHLRSGRITQQQPRKTKGFNVRGRATDADPRNYLITSNTDKELLGKKHGVNVVKVDRIGLVDYYPTSLKLREKTGHTYLLLGYGNDFLYCAPAPLTIRGPRAKAATPSVSDRLPLPPGTDELVIEVEYTEPVTAGSDTPSRNSAMGLSAKNYAAAVFDDEWANARTWEWLHIVGHALGGNNEVENLVAGTYDANTQMIPHEKAIRDAAAKGHRVTAKWEVTLFPDIWVALDITMEYAWIGESGFHFVRQTFPAQTDLAFDKLQYDLWL